uniref:Sodium channel epithelial 1 subunit gamma n=1 Tax=Callorhinchus milii TaxID=7868 RepID=A0A4W3IVZ9_CALMI
MEPGKRKLSAKIMEKLPVTGPQALSMSELARWYCYNTNTHGFRRIVVSRGRLRRGAWVLLTGCAASLIVWQCALLASAYYTVSVSITVHFQELPFPAITICNINPYRSACPTLTGPALATLAGPVRPQHEAEPGEGSRPSLFQNIPLLQIQARGPEYSIVSNLLSRRQHRVNGTVSTHSLGNADILNQEHLVGFKLCEGGDIDSSDCTIYTFTSGMAAVQEWYQLHYYNLLAQVPPEDKRAMGYSADDLFLTCLYDGLPCDSRNFSLHQHPLHGNCFTFNGGENGRVLITRTGGSQNGLKVTLHLDEDEYNPYLVTSTGAKIVVHDQSEHPFVEDLGIAIPAGMETSIGLDLTESHKLGGPYSDCIEDLPEDNLYNKSYSLQMCLHSCFQKEMVQTCGCGHYEKPLPPGAQYCDYNRFPGWIYCYYRLRDRFHREQLVCQELCRQACHGSTRTSLWLQMVTLLSNFGGQLGLWMSCSVICVIEIVEVLLVDALWVLVRSAGQRVRRWWQRPEQEEVPAHGTAHGITVYLEDEDPPTFNAALRLPRQCPPTAPPPNYEMLQQCHGFNGGPEEERF